MINLFQRERVSFCFFQTAKLNLELEVRTDQNLNSNLKMVSLKNFLTIEPLVLCFPFEVII